MSNLKKQLKFLVRGQKLTKDFDPKSIVAGSKGYLQACFEFDNTWTSLTKIVAFQDAQGKEYAFELTNNICDVPDEVTDYGKWSVYVIGIGWKIKIQTTKVNVFQRML